MEAQTVKNLKNLEDVIVEQFRSQNGDFALAFADCDSQVAFSIQGDELFHAASTMKTPVMAELFKQAAQGRFSLNDSITIENKFASIVDGSAYSLSAQDDSDTAIYKMIGQKMTIYDLMDRMIIYSSNLATNILVQFARPQEIMSTLHSLGIKHMKVLRGVEDEKAYEAGLNNVTTANDLRTLFCKIANKELVNATACDKMIRILEDQRHNEVIPALLPPGTRVAHKTGNITGVEHDGGIVFTPDGGKYVLILLSKNLTDRDAAMKMLAQVSRTIYDYMTAADGKFNGTKTQ